MSDLRSLPRDGALASWPSGALPVRYVPSFYVPAFPGAFFGPHRLRDEFDALAFVATTTAAIPTAGAPRRALADLTIAAPANLDFENTNASGAPADWIVPEIAASLDYEITTGAGDAHTGAHAAVIRRGSGKHYGEAAGTVASASMRRHFAANVFA
jgi:hypothetical protein